MKSYLLKLFGNGKYGHFWVKKLMERWHLLITQKFWFWNFRDWEIRSFLKPKRGRKDDIYRLLKSSCFELFEDGKYGLFLSQKFDVKWYLLITEMFLFWTFWRWEILSFFEPKSWWKDDSYRLLKSSCF